MNRRRRPSRAAGAALFVAAVASALTVAGQERRCIYCERQRAGVEVEEIMYLWRGANLRPGLYRCREQDIVECVRVAMQNVQPRRY